MRTIKANSKFISLGRQGENKVTEVVFDLTSWIEEIGSGGQFSLWHRPSGSNIKYPASISVVGGVISWLVTRTDTYISGRGQAEIIYLLNDKIAKTATYETQVSPSLESITHGELSPDEQDYVDKIMEFIEEQNNEDVVSVVVDRYMQDHPIDTLSEDEVKGIIERYKYYSKPSNGIPYVDLDVGVRRSLTRADNALLAETDPTVPLWAKQPNKPTYSYNEILDAPAQSDRFIITVTTNGVDPNRPSMYVVDSVDKSYEEIKEAYEDGKTIVVRHITNDGRTYDYCLASFANDIFSFGGPLKITNATNNRGASITGDGYVTISSTLTTVYYPSGGGFFYTNYVLAKDNTTAFTPTGDYNPATKKYVDDAVSEMDSMITDVRINGTSVVIDGVADIPKATALALGVVATDTWNGTTVDSSGHIGLFPAQETHLNNRTSNTAITPKNLDLALKIALTDGKASWAEEEKESARSLLGIDAYAKKEDLDNILDNLPFEGTTEVTENDLAYELVASKYIKNTGAVSAISNSGYVVTNEVAVIGNTKYKITASANFGNGIIVELGADKNVLNVVVDSVGGASGTVLTDYEITTKADTKYIVVAKVSAIQSTSIRIVEFTEESSVSIRKIWEGKKWTCIGDSLTAVNTRTTKHYHDYISEVTGIDVVNLGISGSGYKKQNPFYDRVSQIPVDSDIVTIFGSGNDLSETLGTPSDNGTDTVCGCVNKCIDDIIARIPRVQLGIIAPTPWNTTPPTSSGNQMELYTEALMSICKRRSIPFLDLYHSSNLRPWTEEGRLACYTKDDGNGVHPDETGHKIIAPRIKSFIDELILNKQNVIIGADVSISINDDEVSNTTAYSSQKTETIYAKKEDLEQLGGISDVQVNGTSVVDGGVANIPIASKTALGAVSAGESSFGIGINSNGALYTLRAGDNEITARQSVYRVITPANLNYAVTAVLTDGKAPALSDAQKAAAQSWLGVSGGSGGESPKYGYFPQRTHAVIDVANSYGMENATLLSTSGKLAHNAMMHGNVVTYTESTGNTDFADSSGQTSVYAMVVLDKFGIRWKNQTAAIDVGTRVDVFPHGSAISGISATITAASDSTVYLFSTTSYIIIANAYCSDGVTRLIYRKLSTSGTAITLEETIGLVTINGSEWDMRTLRSDYTQRTAQANTKIHKSRLDNLYYMAIVQNNVGIAIMQSSDCIDWTLKAHIADTNAYLEACVCEVEYVDNNHACTYVVVRHPYKDGYITLYGFKEGLRTMSDTATLISKTLIPASTSRPMLFADTTNKHAYISYSVNGRRNGVVAKIMSNDDGTGGVQILTTYDNALCNYPALCIMGSSTTEWAWLVGTNGLQKDKAGVSLSSIWITDHAEYHAMTGRLNTAMMGN